MAASAGDYAEACTFSYFDVCLRVLAYFYSMFVYNLLYTLVLVRIRHL